MRTIQRGWRSVAIGLLSLSATVGATDMNGRFFPREYAHIPVNGTDITEDPVALRYAFDLGNKASCNVFECGDHISFLDDIKCLETPHTDWAVPYAGKLPQILAFAGHRAYMRDVIELRHRSDFNFTFAMRPMMYHYAGYRHPSILRHFRNRYKTLLAQDWDVLLLPANDVLNLLDDETLPRIAAKIEAGTPAVIVLNSGDWDRDMYESTRKLLHEISPLTLVPGHCATGLWERVDGRSCPVVDDVAWTLWPSVATVQQTQPRDASVEVLARRGAAPVVATGMYGHGRVVAIVPPVLPGGEETASLYALGDEPVMDDVYELNHSLILKALLWAAAEAPDVVLNVPAEVVAEVGEPFSLTWTMRRKADIPAAGDKPETSSTKDGTPGLPPSGDATGTPLNLVYRLKDPWGTAVHEGSLPVAATTDRATIHVALPALRLQGLHRLDLWLKQGDRVVTWGHAAVRVADAAPFRVAATQIPSRPGQPAGYRMDTAGRSGRVHVTAVDGVDRVFADFTADVADGDSVRLDTERSLHPYNRVTFDFRDAAGQLLGRDIAELYIPRIGMEALQGEYPIISYGRPSVAPHRLRYLGDLYREAGFNTIYYHWHSRHRVWETANTGLLGITGMMPPFLKQNNFEKELKHCPNKPEIRAQWDAKIAEAIGDIQTYGSIARVIDDECYLALAGYRNGEFQGAQACQCEHCLQQFRDAMAQRYETIDALNAAWDTDFPDFDAVRTIEEHEISATGNPSGWLEFRQFMNQVFADNYYGWMARQHAPLGASFQVGPGAPNYTTKEGGPTYKGGDYAALGQSLRFMLAYGGAESEIFGDMFVGQPGAQKYDPPLWWTDWGPWQALLRGADGLWFYSGKQIVGAEIGWRRHAAWIAEGVHDIVRGAGVLLRDAAPLNRQVCVLYSPENLAMGWLFGKRDDAWRGFGLAGGRTRTAVTLTALLRDYFYLQVGTLTEADIERGALAHCRLLLLPAAFNMREETASLIEQWVLDGGCLLADVLPATRTQYGAPREASLLAELFGVDVSAAELHKEQEQWYSVGTEAHPDFYPDVIWLPGDTTFCGVTATTARVYGRMLSREGKESTTFFCNEFGKGQTILLNFVLSGLNTGSSGWFRLFGEILLDRAGVRPPARIVDPKTGAPLFFRPLYAFESGSATVLASLRGGSMWTGGRPVLIDHAAAFSADTAARFEWDEPRHVYDLRAGTYLGFTDSATVDLPSFQARVLTTLPYKVQEVEVTAPERVSAGAVCSIRARVRTDGLPPGRHTLYMEVRSPTGVRQPLYCATRATDAEEAAWSIPFADNDRPGVWRIAVRDVLTGVEAETAIVVE